MANKSLKLFYHPSNQKSLSDWQILKRMIPSVGIGMQKWSVFIHCW